MNHSGCFRTVITTLGVVVVLGAVLPFVVFAVPGTVGADNSYVVLSSSMRPTFDAGDVIFVEEVPTDSIEEGDVITYREGTAEVIANGNVDLITHRVTDVIRTEEGVLFRTQGDANDSPDPQAVAPGDVVGEVRFHLPYMGYVVSFASTETGMIVMVGLPLGLLVANEGYLLAAAAWHDRDRIREALGGRGGN